MLNINSIVLKVASRCNLNCSYCYMYNLGDTTYLQQPKFFSKKNIDFLVMKIFEYMRSNRLNHFTIIFHGGEPLLYPKENYIYLYNKIQQLMENNDWFQVRLAMQTNGVLITKEWCILFKKLKIDVGISIDGTKSSHDKFRIDHKGRGSYDKVLRGIKVYKEHFPSIGVISVINVDESPKEVYFSHKRNCVNGFNLLFPDKNYDTVNQDELSNTKYADWLIELFEMWYKDVESGGTDIKINIFHTIINLILGNKQFGNELYGINENGVIVVETNGDIETVDTLKSCKNGFTKGTLNIATNNFDEIEKDELINLYYNSHNKLHKKCLSCPILEVCGGGYLVHRYRSENGFNNPSIYCSDYMKLIVHIQNKLFSSFTKKELNKLGIDILSIEKINKAINEKLNDDKKYNKNEEYLKKFATFN